MLHIRDLTFTYPQASRPALRGISLHVPRGAFALLTGPSGSGKSTLLRALNGLVPHFSGGRIAGQVRVDGRDPLALGPQTMSRHAGFVFQDPEAQFVVEQVEDEIAFALENAGMPRPEMRRRVERALEQTALQRFRSRKITSLSGGEQQRVALAAALALRPSLLVLDEPTSQLDPQSAEEILAALKALHAQGMTVILAEHRLERVLPLADWVIALTAGGGLLACGPRDEVLPQLETLPPVTEVGRALGWKPLAIDVRSAGYNVRSAGCGVRGTTYRVQRTGYDVRGTMYAVRCVGLEVRYGEMAALRGVSLEVGKGEILALMGRNGAGKSTLLRAVMGLLPLHEGDILLEGQSIRGWETAQRARRIAFLPQDPNALLFAESVAEELAVTLRNHGMKVDEAAIAALLERLGLGDKAHRYPRDLSVGERQRVALGAVTITRPAVLLLDEPTRGLDAQSKAQLADLLDGWRAEGMGIVLATHDVELVARLADRVALLEAGRLSITGAPLKVFEQHPEFAPQMVRLFPGCGWLTAEEAIAHLKGKAAV